MKKGLSLIIISFFMIFIINDGVYSQNADNSLIEDILDVKDDINEYLTELFNDEADFGSDFTNIEAARKKFNSLSNERKKEIIERWQDFKKLEPEQRQKISENFRRLVELETRTLKLESTDTPNFESNINSENLLMQLVRIELNEAHRTRLHQYNEYVYAIKKDEPNFFVKMRAFSDKERNSEIIKKRNEIIQSEVAEISLKLDLDENMTNKLHRLIQKHINQTDKLQFDFNQKMEKIWEDSAKYIQNHIKIGEKIINNLRGLPDRSSFRIFEDIQPQNNKHHRIQINRFRDRSLFDIPDVNEFNRIIKNLNLNAETQELLSEIYDEIINMLQENKQGQKNNHAFWRELIARTCLFLDSEHIKKFSAILAEIPEMPEKHREPGFRQNPRNPERKSSQDGNRKPNR